MGKLQLICVVTLATLFLTPNVQGGRRNSKARDSRGSRASLSGISTTAKSETTTKIPELVEKYESPWTWKCVDGSSCQRSLSNATEEKSTLNVCWLTCGQYGAMWPFPTIQSHLGKGTLMFYPQSVEVTSIQGPSRAVKSMMGYAGNVFLDHLFRMHPKSEGQSAFPVTSGGKGIEHNVVTISLTAQSSETRISLNTNEKYSVVITSYLEGQGRHIHVDVSAVTFFGVRHGLETLGQLIAFDDDNESLRIVSEAIIQDQPKFKYRGLMIDTSRNFIPIHYLKRMVDAMSYNKLNMLHWHITDTNSFPFYSKRVPQMTKYGAYSASQIYMPKDVKELVLYARLRGVKILPEFDAPAHAGNGWQWGPLEGIGELALCVNAEPWRNYCGQPPCGQLNPLNNYTYLVLGEIYKDMLELFDRDIFHMGGDEVFLQCWYYQDEIRNWQRSSGSYDLMDLWGLFQQKALTKLKDANYGHPITPIVWTSDMTTRGRRFLDASQYIIQIWTGSTHSDVRSLLEGNYRVIFSNVDNTYLDHGFGTWLGRDHFWTIKTWQNLYDNDLMKIAEYHFGENATSQVIDAGLILGGEATLWAEKVDQYNMEMKLWPRSAAFAERLWSSPTNRTSSVYGRLIHHRARMVRRGVHADRLQPESCHQLSGYCSDPYSQL
ncbi:unnamed protein product [Allacma fusca]|uniref:Beta-hexosaminidase n=1 Tax=Allacma fusca TaxID=39272 RepID=A0A8J2LPF5_9HEXA|nr:unnamed protein product [Allacma fusca]